MDSCDLVRAGVVCGCVLKFPPIPNVDLFGKLNQLAPKKRDSELAAAVTSELSHSVSEDEEGGGWPQLPADCDTEEHSTDPPTDQRTPQKMRHDLLARVGRPF